MDGILVMFATRVVTGTIRTSQVTWAVGIAQYSKPRIRRGGGVGGRVSGGGGGGGGWGGLAACKWVFLVACCQNGGHLGAYLAPKHQQLS